MTKFSAVPAFSNMVPLTVVTIASLFSRVLGKSPFTTNSLNCCVPEIIFTIPILSQFNDLYIVSYPTERYEVIELFRF